MQPLSALNNHSNTNANTLKNPLITQKVIILYSETDPQFNYAPNQGSKHSLF